MKCFISYARANQAALDRLINCLDEEYEVWWDKKILGGQSWWDEILKAIEDCSFFLVAITPESMASIYCKAEWEYAEQIEKPLIPVELIKVDMSLVPEALRKIQFAPGTSDHHNVCEELMQTLHETKPSSTYTPDKTKPRPDVPLAPLEQISKAVKELQPTDDQDNLLKQLAVFLDEPEQRNIALRTLKTFHRHQNVLANTRDDIEDLAPQLRRVVFVNRNESARHIPYSAFVSKAQETIHNYGAGLGSVGPDIKLYQDAITRGVSIHFMHLDRDTVTDGTARFFSKEGRSIIVSEIETTLQHLKQLSNHAKAYFPDDYFTRVMVRLRETGPDIGVIARDLDTPNGAIRVEPYLYDAPITERLGFLFFPEQELYPIYRDMIKRLWEDAHETVAAIILNQKDPSQVLLTKRSINPFKGFWCIPGGFIEVGETRQAAILREVEEETGLAFAPQFFRRFFENFPQINHRFWVNVFVGESTNEAFRPQETEVSEIAWFDLDEAIKMKESLAFRHKEVLEAYKKSL